jgi:aspartokinase/homoserine dehydrogenase 1
MHDATLSTLARKAQSEGKRLRYIGSLADGKATISLQAVGPEHPFYNLSGCDNIISITSKYYAKSPLVIRGPGAGADVTAARVLEGIVRSQQK